MTDPALPKADEKETFSDLGVHPDITAALERVGIVHPFPIQSLSIPLSLSGTDLIGQARTGTGKTLAFGITVLQRVKIESDPGYAHLKAPGKPQALILTPTRELAIQVAKDLEVENAAGRVDSRDVAGPVSISAKSGDVGVWGGGDTVTRPARVRVFDPAAPQTVSRTSYTPAAE